MRLSAGIIISILTGLTPLLQAQDIESLRKEFDAFKKEQEKSMADYRRAQERSMDSLRAAANAAFARLLNEEWELRSTLRHPEAYSKPKPKDPPARDGTTIPAIPPKTSPDRNRTPDTNPTSVDPAPRNYASELEREFSSVLTLRKQRFFQQPVLLPEVNSYWPRPARPLSEKSISEYFTSCARQWKSRSLDLMELQRKSMRMNDWAFHLLVNQWAEMNFTDAAEQNLFIWYTLIQHGYDVRLFYDDGAVVLGYATDRMLYGVSYIEMEGRQYRLLRPGAQRFYTYPKQNQMATRILRLEDVSLVDLRSTQQTRRFKFSHQGQSYDIPLNYDGSRLDLYKTLPYTEFGFYITEQGHPLFRQHIRETLQPLVARFQQPIEKVRFLHSLVMYSLPYQTDQEQFGYEKFCLPEEILHYPYADCEDRAFLLSYLVRELIGLRTIALHYPGHLALAVEIPGAPEFMDRIRHGNRSYVYCDATYFGADIGRIPESYKNLFPVVHGAQP